MSCCNSSLPRIPFLFLPVWPSGVSVPERDVVPGSTYCLCGFGSLCHWSIDLVLDSFNTHSFSDSAFPWLLHHRLLFISTRPGSWRPGCSLPQIPFLFLPVQPSGVYVPPSVKVHSPRLLHVDNSDHPLTKDLLSCLDCFNFKQHINFPTHTKGHTWT